MAIALAGMRLKAGIRIPFIPWFKYVGVLVEVTYSKGDALKQCDKYVPLPSELAPRLYV